MPDPARAGGLPASEIHRSQRHCAFGKLVHSQEVPRGLLCNTAMAGRKALAFPALALPTTMVSAAGCFLPLPQWSGKALFHGGSWSQLPAACQWRRGSDKPPASIPSTASQLRGISFACKYGLIFLGHEGAQLTLFVWHEHPVTVYFSRLAAFNSSWQCHEAASPAGRAVGAAALWGAGTPQHCF